MQFRISTFSAVFLASSVLLAVPFMVEAFAPSVFPQQKQSSSTRLFYTMPDVTSMKATEIRQELESYGINTNTFFEKRQFEEALIEARRHYESTINDVMSSNRPKKKKVQTRRKTEHYEEYEVGARQRQHQKQQQRAEPSYSDPAVRMKYQAALQESYNMKVEDLQHELNSRGISTKYCMIFKDFCIEYAKAIAENREKVVSEDEDEDDETSIFGDDDGDYDPSYRDVVMQKYDPSMWI
eukprot:jgi/Psemu1/284710/fgenesh1_pg.62_\